MRLAEPIEVCGFSEQLVGTSWMLPPRLGLLSKIAAISMRYELIRLGRSGHE
jgi:hypothetical protein